MAKRAEFIFRRIRGRIIPIRKGVGRLPKEGRRLKRLATKASQTEAAIQSARKLSKTATFGKMGRDAFVGTGIKTQIFSKTTAVDKFAKARTTKALVAATQKLRGEKSALRKLRKNPVNQPSDIAISRFRELNFLSKDIRRVFGRKKRRLRGRR